MSTFEAAFFEQLSRNVMTQILSHLETSLVGYKNEEGETVTAELLASFLQMEVPKVSRAIATLPKPASSKPAAERKAPAKSKDLGELPEITGKCGRILTRGANAGNPCGNDCDKGARFCKTCKRLKCVMDLLEHHGVSDEGVPAEKTGKAPAKTALPNPPPSRRVPVSKAKEAEVELEEDEEGHHASASTSKATASRFGAKLPSMAMKLPQQPKRTEVTSIIDDSEEEEEYLSDDE